MPGPGTGEEAGAGTPGNVPVRRKLAAILAADAVGYSRLMGADEEGTLRVLRGHRQAIDAVIALHGGRIVGTAGDSVLAEFESAVVAVRCAVEIQEALKTRNAALPEGERLLFRIGINLGDVIVSGDDLLGDGVNVAARLEGIAEPGGINVSSSVYDQIAGKLDLGFIDVGPQTLKNIARPIHVYRVGSVASPRKPPSRALSGRRAWCWSAVGVAAVLVAGVATWSVSGWRPPLPPPAVDPELARARAEAEAARQRARAEEDRAREAQRLLDEGRAAAARAQADAELARARAEAEAIKRRAESEAAASASAAAARAPAAERASTPPPAAPAPAGTLPPAPSAAAATGPGPAVTTAPPAATAAVRPNASGYDGAWTVTRDCEPERPGARGGRLPIIVTGGEFVIDSGAPGQPGAIRLRGRPSPDGELELNGTVVGVFARNRGRELPVRFAGRAEGDRFVLRGEVGQRPCTLTLARAG